MRSDELSKQRAIGMGPHFLLESSERSLLLQLVIRLIRRRKWAELSELLFHPLTVVSDDVRQTERWGGGMDPLENRAGLHRLDHLARNGVGDKACAVEVDGRARLGVDGHCRQRCW